MYIIRVLSSTPIIHMRTGNHAGNFLDSDFKPGTYSHPQRKSGKGSDYEPSSSEIHQQIIRKPPRFCRRLYVYMYFTCVFSAVFNVFF